MGNGAGVDPGVVSAGARPSAANRSAVQAGLWLRRGRALAAAVVLAPLYAVYTRRLRALVRTRPSPHHVAVILDGNRRWANLLGLREPGAGHRRGADKLGELIGWCSGLGIAELTVWALSTENLARPGDELAALTQILADELGALAERATSEEVPMRIRVFRSHRGTATAAGPDRAPRGGGDRGQRGASSQRRPRL